MKLSYDWLSDYVDLSALTPEDVAEKLTMGAFEVEEIKRIGPDIRGQVVVGEIVEILPHPDPAATKIRLTRTRVSPGQEPIEIICGAWNIEPGQHIPVALPGSIVINRKTGEPLPIERGKIRGTVSNGMLCSPPELGVEGNGEGILILDKSAPVGADARELLNIKQDAVLYVEPRSNRGDALCVVGLAREVAALTGRQLKQPHWQLPAPETTEAFGVGIENAEDCPFFSIRVLNGVKIGPSPAWMARRLEAVGVRSVNNVVDITNYVLQEYGQPLHAYDIARLGGNHLEVRSALSGEILDTLDGKKRELSPEVLVIADKQGVVGIAGVMGGKGSEISDDTTQVALEAADFSITRVRRSSRLLGLSSDSSLRFERGVDLAGVRHASDRAAYLLVEHCGAVLGALSTAGSDKLAPLFVGLNLAEVTRLTELEVDAKQAAQLLQPLGFGVELEAPGKLKVQVPSFRRRDVTRQADLVEEVTRLYGYDRVPVSMPKRTVAPPLPDTIYSTIKQALAACGLNECWISSLVALDDLSGRGSFPAEEAAAIKVLNPLSDEHQVLRLSLIPGLLKALEHNLAHGRDAVWLFEAGLTYHRLPGQAVDRSRTGTQEIAKVAAAIVGQESLGSWTAHVLPSANGKSSGAVEFYVLKGVLENLMQALSIPTSNLLFAAPQSAPSWFHPKRCAAVSFRPAARDSQPIALGHVGELHPLVADAYGIKQPAAIFELDVQAMRESMHPRAFNEFFSTPTIVRDLTCDLSADTAQASAAQLIRQVGGQLLRNVELVSIYELNERQRSLSYRLTFQHAEQTLTAPEIDKAVQKIRDQLARQLSATFRA